MNNYSEKENDLYEKEFSKLVDYSGGRSATAMLEESFNSPGGNFLGSSIEAPYIDDSEPSQIFTPELVQAIVRDTVIECLRITGKKLSGKRHDFEEPLRKKYSRITLITVSRQLGVNLINEIKEIVGEYE